MKRIAVIGAGPAGIFAALQAARSEYEVHLLDSNQQVGRKLLVTGSGRCNITNRDLITARYSSSKPDFVRKVVEKFDQNRLLDYLNELGIYTYSTDDGWVYPISNSAANVVSLLLAHLNAARVNLHPGTIVTDIQPDPNGFFLFSDPGFFPTVFDRVIIASGGKAYPELGSRGTLFPVLAHLGHTVQPIFPALAPILTDRKPIQKLKGVRLDAGVKLFARKKLLGETLGNIIFTDWGINGPGVMDISHLAAQNPYLDLYLVIDFLLPHAKYISILKENRNLKSVAFSILLGSVLPAKLIQPVFTNLNLSLDAGTEELGEINVRRILQALGGFKVEVKGTRGFEYSQASTGGIYPGEVDEASLQSRLLPGIFFAGEVLDVVGPCGGYNLQWAFSSGFLAGCSAVL